MARVYTNTACELYGTKYCSMLNMKSCENCIAAKGEDVGRVVKDLDVIESMMPSDGISDLFTGDTCMLCKGESRNKRSCYASIDLGNPEPKHQKRSVIGIKVTVAAGSLIPVQLSCCDHCRRVHRLIEYLPISITVSVPLITLVLMSFRAIREPLLAINSMAPFVVFIVVTAAAALTGTLLRAAAVKKYSHTTRMSIFEIPKLKEMQQNGWFELTPGKGGVSKLLFSRKLLSQGLYTGVTKKTGA